MLDLDKFWNWKIREKKTKFSTDQIFRLLTFSRALSPGSKRYTLENKDFFFEPFNGFSLDDIYHALDIIAANQDDLQKWSFDHSKKICERNISTSYFDCTNYYFDIRRPDVDALDEKGNPVDADGNPAPAKYRKRGPEKNHQLDPKDAGRKNIHLHPQKANKPNRRIGTIPYRYWDCAGFASKLELTRGTLYFAIS